jgi:hypothetical protein
MLAKLSIIQSSKMLSAFFCAFIVLLPRIQCSSLYKATKNVIKCLSEIRRPRSVFCYSRHVTTSSPRASPNIMCVSTTSKECVIAEHIAWNHRAELSSHIVHWIQFSLSTRNVILVDDLGNSGRFFELAQHFFLQIGRNWRMKCPKIHV